MDATAEPYLRLQRSFRWRLPGRYNIGRAIVDVWAKRDPDRLAILSRRADGRLEPASFGFLREQSNRLANVLVRQGVCRGDRVAILLPQSAEVVIAHAAVMKLGALALPLASVFGPDALVYRLRHSGARAIVLDAAGATKVAGLRAALPDLQIVLDVDGAAQGGVDLREAMSGADARFDAVDSGVDDPAMMIYTSGTTGPPKGALHAHRVLLGHLPGFRFAHSGFPAPGDLMWTPADWAWAGGLLNALMPSLALGAPVLAWPYDKFSAEEAIAVIAEAGVRNVFLPPTALRMMKAARPEPLPLGLRLRSVMSAGETLGAETFGWAQAALGTPVDELYGQTECNLVIGSSSALGVSRPGATGKPVFGHRVAILGPDGRAVSPGEVGEIAIRRPDPVMFLGYWNDGPATAAKFRGDFLLTGDRAWLDEEGYVHFVGRDDDIITSSGYRIGPGEVEDCLARHPAVAYAAAVGKPDALRTEIVKAFIVLRPGSEPSPALTAEIQAFVRQRLSAHEYPREISYLGELPVTETGKIMRRLLRERG